MFKLLAHPLVAVGMTILAVLFVLSLRKTAQKSEVASQNVAVLEQKITDLSRELEEEQKALEYDSSDFAREKILRNDLLLQKPGEYILQIPDENLVQNNTETASTKTPWEEWKALLF